MLNRPLIARLLFALGALRCNDEEWAIVRAALHRYRLGHLSYDVALQHEVAVVERLLAVGHRKGVPEPVFYWSSDQDKEVEAH